MRTEVIINRDFDPSDKIKKIDGVQYVPKSLYDDVVADRRNIAMDNAKLYKDIADLKKTMRNKKNEIEKKSTDSVRLKPEKLERRIYPCWAFELNGVEKGRINNEIYLDLIHKHKIAYELGNNEAEVIILIEYQTYCKRYKVVRNYPQLDANSIALIVDNGSLCFGYTGTNTDGKVWLT